MAVKINQTMSLGCNTLCKVWHWWWIWDIMKCETDQILKTRFKKLNRDEKIVPWGGEITVLAADPSTCWQVTTLAISNAGDLMSSYGFCGLLSQVNTHENKIEKHNNILINVKTIKYFKKLYINTYIN